MADHLMDGEIADDPFTGLLPAFCPVVSAYEFGHIRFVKVWVSFLFRYKELPASAGSSSFGLSLEDP